MIISMPKSFFVPIAYVDEKFLEVNTEIDDNFRDKDDFNIYDIIDDEYARTQREKNI